MASRKLFERAKDEGGARSRLSAAVKSVVAARQRHGQNGAAQTVLQHHPVSYGTEPAVVFVQE